MRTFSKLLSLLLFLLCSSFIYSQVPGPVTGKNGMVVSASELASKVGVEILKKDGNAVDASVAVGFALAVTYPAAGNIGGGGFMVIRLNDGTSTSIDYREKAPASTHPKIYIDESGNPLPEKSAEGVTSAGVPGSVAGLIYALEKYGTLPIQEVIQPAIDLALNGFELDYRMAESFKSTLETFRKYEPSLKIFSKDGEPFEAGDLFIQKDLGRTLSIIKEKGRDGFYKGEIADLIVKQMNQMSGWITHDDLANYQPSEREPIIGSYRGYDIISMGPPSAGGVLLVQVLNILENLKFNRNQWGSSSYIHHLVEALKYAYADRSKHIGDPDFYEVPIDKLTSKKICKRNF